MNGQSGGQSGPAGRQQQISELRKVPRRRPRVNAKLPETSKTWHVAVVRMQIQRRLVNN